MVPLRDGSLTKGMGVGTGMGTDCNKLRGLNWIASKGSVQREKCALSKAVGNSSTYKESPHKSTRTYLLRATRSQEIAKNVTLGKMRTAQSGSQRCWRAQRLNLGRMKDFGSNLQSNCSIDGNMVMAILKRKKPLLPSGKMVFVRNTSLTFQTMPNTT